MADTDAESETQDRPRRSPPQEAQPPQARQRPHPAAKSACRKTSSSSHVVTDHPLNAVPSKQSTTRPNRFGHRSNAQPPTPNTQATMSRSRPPPAPADTTKPATRELSRPHPGPPT